MTARDDLEQRQRLMRLIADGGNNRLAAAETPECPPDILDKLVQDYHRYPDSAIFALQNPNLPVSSLYQHALSKEEDIVCAIVHNPRCPAALLRGLYLQQYTYLGAVIKASILAHPNVEVEYLDLPPSILSAEETDATR